MIKNSFEVQNNLTYEQMCNYRDSLRDKNYFDEWGELQVWLPIRIDGIMYGAELNLACDGGEDNTAIYLMRDDGNNAETDTGIVEIYEGMEIVKEFAMDTINNFLVEYMCEFVMAHIKTQINRMLTNGTFINNPEKMIDFFSVSKDEFLKSYSYLTEEEYDVTRNYLKFLNDLDRHDAFLSGREM